LQVCRQLHIIDLPGFTKKIKNKKLYNTLKNDHGGTGHVGNKPDFIGRINSFIYSPFTLSFDYLYQDISILDKIIKYQLKVNKEEKEITLSLISHPKALGSYHLQQMDKFIDLIRTRYKDSVEICGFRDL